MELDAVFLYRTQEQHLARGSNLMFSPILVQLTLKMSKQLKTERSRSACNSVCICAKIHLLFIIKMKELKKWDKHCYSVMCETSTCQV